jgi:hypothetical protein
MSFTVERDWITSAGLRAVVIMVEDMGHRCGYVGLPVEHPLFGVGYSDKSPALKANMERSTEKLSPIDVLCAAASEPDELNSPLYMFEVHGGITYAGKGDYPVASDLWWYGYDCAHGGDVPRPEVVKAKYPGRGYWEQGVHRSLDYCLFECESLAAQLATVAA